ncbi:D-sedoheptulose 7-phosphate isomerase [Martelella mediterranea]|uniref:D-sedoheptulose-7-phosphate isomerase n=1 Tax=Martelella mediterranea TaxID=293089 RepID=UPI001E53E8F5|nr:D-sedoheptulose 7-phosphate isomerase [Martelella mediterranea]MCD1636965.1 D-sedoheptulose 7-phosphate isomerase [Martelella mediterranea]
MDEPIEHLGRQNEVLAYFSETEKAIRASRVLAPEVVRASELCVSALRNGGKIIFCGNGGSAADAQHLAAELMGRFLIDREPLPALSLTVDTSALTAIGNDYGFDKVFSRQLRGIAQKGDVVFGLSTSGNSTNVIEAFNLARSLGLSTIGLTGQGGGKMKEISDVLIAVPHGQTNHIQEVHIAIGHLICAFVEAELCQSKQ